MKEKVFITGGTGFIGSELVPKLIDNYEVYALARYVSNRQPKLPTDVNVVYGDLQDESLIKKQVMSINPDIIIHLGAITPVMYSFDHENEVMGINLFGTLNLAQAARKCSNLKMFVYASTSEVYGIQDVFPIAEHQPPNPNTVYAISKVACENYLKYLGQAYDFPYVIARPFNSYGRKDNHNFVVEGLIYQMLTSKTTYLGDPKPIRDFMYVDDHVDGYLKILEGQYTNTTVNFCTGRCVSIEELVGIIAKEIEYKGAIVCKKTYQRATEIPKLVGNYSYAQMMWGWNPEYTLETGIKKTVEFWRNKVGVK